MSFSCQSQFSIFLEIKIHQFSRLPNYLENGASHEKIQKGKKCLKLSYLEDKSNKFGGQRLQGNIPTQILEIFDPPSDET